MIRCAEPWRRSPAPVFAPQASPSGRGKAARPACADRSRSGTTRDGGRRVCSGCEWTRAATDGRSRHFRDRSDGMVVELGQPVIGSFSGMACKNRSIPGSTTRLRRVCRSRPSRPASFGHLIDRGQPAGFGLGEIGRKPGRSSQAAGSIAAAIADAWRNNRSRRKATKSAVVMLLNACSSK